MKSINLIVTKENIQGRDTFFTTYDLLKAVINNPQEGGFTVEEMMNRVRLLNKVEEFKNKFFIDNGTFGDSDLLKEDVLQLEDADFVKLKELFKKMKWGIVSSTIINLHNELESL